MTALPRLLMLVCLVAVAALAPTAGAQFFPAMPGAPIQTPPIPLQNAPPPEWLNSPRATVQTFLEASKGLFEERDERQRARATASLELGEFGKLLLDDARLRLIDELRDVLVRLGVKPLVAELPDAAAVAAAGITSFNLPLTYPPEAEPLTLVRGPDGAWRFGETSLARIEDLHDELFGQDNVPNRAFRSVGLDWLASNRLLGLTYATWAGLFAVILFGVAADLIIRIVSHYFAQRYLKRHGEDTHSVERRDLIKRTATPFGLVAGGVTIYALLPLLDLPIRAEGLLRTASKAFFLFAMVWAAYRVVDLVAERFQRKVQETDSGGVNTLLIPLVTKAVKLFILALGLIFVAESLNMPVTSLLAGVGIGGIALAVAARGTLENVFGTVSVILDRPFRVGDWVKIGDTEGAVEEFSLRSTRVRTYNQSLVTVPNATLVSASIENLGMREYRRCRFTVSLMMDTPVAKVEQFCAAVRAVLRAHPHTRKEDDHVFLTEFAPSSLQVFVAVFLTGVETWEQEFRIRHELMLGVISAAEKTGVRFAFPTTTVHLAAGGQSPTPPVKVDRL